MREDRVTACEGDSREFVLAAMMDQAREYQKGDWGMCIRALRA